MSTSLSAKLREEPAFEERFRKISNFLLAEDPRAIAAAEENPPRKIKTTTISNRQDESAADGSVITYCYEKQTRQKEVRWDQVLLRVLYAPAGYKFMVTKNVQTESNRKGVDSEKREDYLYLVTTLTGEVLEIRGVSDFSEALLPSCRYVAESGTNVNASDLCPNGYGLVKSGFAQGYIAQR
jgi:hypothetical protein